jgi:hypothetical protein
MEIETEFSLIGEDDDEVADLQQAGPGTVAPIRQRLFQAADEGFGKGDEVGVLHGVAIVVRRAQVIAHLVFEFDEGHTLVATGVLPAGASHFGDGVLAVTGGTGGFERSAGACTVATMNPKRWNFSI